MYNTGMDISYWGEMTRLPSFEHIKRRKIGEPKNEIEEKILDMTDQVAFKYRALFGSQYIHSQLWISQKQRPPSTPHPSKSAASSCALRAMASEQNRSVRKIEDAFKKFNESLARAPPRMVDYCLAMSGRSALHDEFRDYVACIVDSNRVCQLIACPDRLKKEHVDRNQKCLAKIHELNLLKNDFETYNLLLVERATAKDKFVPIFSDLIKNKVEPDVITGKETDLSQNDRMMRNVKYLNADTLKNEFIPNANLKIQVAHNFQYGRHVVANEDIEATEIILYEEAFASVLFSDFSKTHCSHCFMRTNALIPCEECVDSMYCGEQCRSHAFKWYHQIECKVIDFMRTIGSPLNQFDLLTLRTTLIGIRRIGGLNTVWAQGAAPLPPDFLRLKRTFVGEELKNNYSHVCNLERCVSTLSPELQDYIESRCSQLLYGLSYASYFGDLIVSADSTELQKAVGLHLINNYFVILGNPFNVNEVVFQSQSPPANKYYHSLGAALYPTTSLMNHSCDPNCSYYFVGNRVILYANRPIKAGEQLFCSYGPLFTTQDRKARQEKLWQYGFQCKCDACEMDWPLMKDVPNQPTPLPDRDRAAAINIINTLKDKIEYIEWNVRNFSILNNLLEFHQHFASLSYNYYTHPSLWSVVSFIEMGRLVEMHGNLHLGDEKNHFGKDIEELLEYALSVDFRKWFD